MTQNENRDDLYEYGRRGRGVGLSIMTRVAGRSSPWRAGLVWHAWFERDERRAARASTANHRSRNRCPTGDAERSPSG